MVGIVKPGTGRGELLSSLSLVNLRFQCVFFYAGSDFLLTLLGFFLCFVLQVGFLKQIRRLACLKSHISLDLSL